jgi:murein L,D-transpeptidase YafK
MRPEGHETMLRSCVAVAVLAALLVASAPARADLKAASAPIPAALVSLMSSKGTSPSAPLLIRVFKKESELEVWKKAGSGRYVLVKTYPICRWSGQLGPKRRQGDRQAPEGFYSVTPRQMNPNSSYYLSFDTGFPNAYDRAQGATGSALMVHGTCSSMGCYAMTDKQIGEIYAVAREAFAGGQKAFQFQAFPFRMTADNLARHRSDPNYPFWRQLKEGSDRFEATGEEPTVTVSAGRYAFAPLNDQREAIAQARIASENQKIADLSQATAVVKTIFADGGQHPSFRLLAQQDPASLGMVSRPEALAYAGREVVLVPARKKPLAEVVALLPPPRPDFEHDAKAPVPAGEIRLPVPLVEGTTLADLVTPDPMPVSVADAAPLAGSVRVLAAALDLPTAQASAAR